MSTICSPLSSQLIISNISLILTIFQWFFTGIELGDVDWWFSLMLVRKANAVDEETKWAMSLYHQHKQSIHMTNGVTVMPLTASLLQKIVRPKKVYVKSCYTENYHVNLKSDVNFQVVLTWNCAKRTHIKQDLPEMTNVLAVMKISGDSTTSRN